ncbi:MAG: hypothetical protein ACJAV5_000161 [Vicingaceae bacterium]|jgi:hypothetical protein
MKIGDFFIWCAGSDTDLLSHCSQIERNKHIGYGTLVLIPAILAFVSMSYALSTVEGITNQPLLYYSGGFIWSLIIFSFDRFIVSTHVRKMDDRSELKSPAFFLRLGFALILGIVISHPLVMLYFNGSVQDRITQNTELHKKQIEQEYDSKIITIEAKLLQLDEVENKKIEQRNTQAEMVAKEIDGEVIKNSNGEIATTGLYGKGPSAENKISQLATLEKELNKLRIEQDTQKKTYNSELIQLKNQQDSAIAAYSISSDYLKREMALEQLKEKHSIVRVTQYFLIALFILVDILPFIFKTFSPFGMYDRILLDDSLLVKDLDHKSRKVYLEKVYKQLSEA